MPKLTVREIKGNLKPGMHGDGQSLYLRVGPNGAKSWILRTSVYGKRRELGLGAFPMVSLVEARETAAELRKVARQGGDPDAVRKRESLTFDEAARRVHSNLLPTWRNKKHADSWLASVENYASPKFGNRPIHTVQASDILNVLTPIWVEKNETAKRLKQRLMAIFDWAKGAGHYPHENPVNGIKKALPVIKRPKNHLAAMDWRDVPAFMDELESRDGISARTLRFIILTASRSGEARGAKWSEIDLDKRVWTVPAERMKRGIEHKVPLSDAAIAVLKSIRGLDPDLVFPSEQRAKGGGNRPLSVMVFKSLFQRMRREGFTVHGFRSTFRDWCSESVRADREVAEAALAHATGNAVERAYARSDLFERRRELMDAWGNYATGKSGDVVQMVRA